MTRPRSWDRRRASAALAAWWSDDLAQLLALAVVIGATAGVAVIGFYRTIDVIEALVLGGAPDPFLGAAALVRKCPERAARISRADRHESLLTVLSPAS